MNAERFKFPERICFNFLDKCNMTCPFCYCPFSKEKSDFCTWKKIIKHILKWELQNLTFGGGDPFFHCEFPELLKYIRDESSYKLPFIQVDTNGVKITNKHYEIIERAIDLIGIPLDGSLSVIHNNIRGYSGSFQKIIRLLNDLSDRSVSIKINTLVCNINIDDLDNISDLLKNFNVKHWSLYELWPIEGTRSSDFSKYSVPNSKFLRKAISLKDKCNFTHIEIATISTRNENYFFINQIGKVYSVSKEKPHKYLFIGSIFDDSTLNAWNDIVKNTELSQRLNERMKLD